MKPRHLSKVKAAVAASAASESQERIKLQNFLRVFIIFAILSAITFILFHRVQSNGGISTSMNTANSVFYAATHNAILNFSNPEHIIDLDKLHLPILTTTVKHLDVSSLPSQGAIPAAAAATSNSVGVADPSVRFELLSKLTAFKQRTDEILLLITDTSISEQKPFIRWDLISNADVHILHKLSKHLNRVLSKASADKEYQQQLVDSIQNGYQCSALQASQQERIAKFISMDICSEVEWYKVVQLAWPEASHFIDVGANKGFLASLFLTLWGGGGLDLPPSQVLKIAQQHGLWKESRNPGGYCRDGFNSAIALHCPAPNKRVWDTARCNMANNNVRISSIDGSSYLASTLTRVIQQLSPSTALNQELRKGNLWQYHNYAVYDVDGVATFTKQAANMNAGFEGGHIHDVVNSRRKLRHQQQQQRRLAAEVEHVNMTTIDSFVQRQGMLRVDVLKIDTEGKDNRVLTGAVKTLREKVGMFTFEGGKGVTFSKEMLVEYDAMGFSCYSTSRAGLFKWSSGCMKEQYLGGFKAKDKGNIFCVSRSRAPMVAFAFDILSFPAMIDDHILDHQQQQQQQRSSSVAAAAVRSSLVSRMQNEATVAELTPAELTPLYINIKPFCTPWPTCAKI